MNIWLIGIGEALPIEGPTYRRWRTGMLAEELVKQGHHVTWWASTFDHFSKRHVAKCGDTARFGEHLVLRFLHGRAYASNISWQRLVNHIQIARDFLRQTRHIEPPDAIFCSFPPIELAATAARYCVTRGVVLIVDINDLWPDEIINRTHSMLRPIASLLLAPLRHRVNATLGQAHSVVAISDTFLQWASVHGRRVNESIDSVFALGYSPIRLHENQMEDETFLSSMPIRNKLVVLFAGTFVGNVDLRTVVDAARILANDQEIVFVLAGTGEGEKDIRERARGLNNVIFPGWLSQRQIRALGSIAKIGLAPYRSGALMTLPNKTFEYLALGLPVLNSLSGETRKLVESCEIGESYEAGNPQSLAGRLVELVRDRTRIQKYSKNAKEVFAEKYSSARIYPQLVNHIEHVVRKHALISPQR